MPADDPTSLYEKMGAFYLGRLLDRNSGEITPDLLLYDSKDLTTHAVCVGMTGSGKTGLCIGLLEEAAMDGIPALAIDPKGDLGNLLLTFPDLRAEDFLPWVDPGEAARKGSTPEAFARDTAAKWRAGLEEWGQSGERIRRLREAADFSIYTPGSNAGLPLTVLNSFSAPPAALQQDADLLRERVETAVSGLLALIGVEADPLRSREHILLAQIFERFWREGHNLDVATIIRLVQSPPFERIGVLDLESFFPSRDRGELALSLNNLLASPGFAAWMEGEPLDIQRLLWTPAGKPRITILSIAHLTDRERMFFVTLVLNEVRAWMRAQSGTTSLRALLYMDEIFGYFPPTANPPSKMPMLTLLKQARAYGLGVVLATQNPVDLDYKGLANTGTWFIGRLQTERDKMRVLEGLEGASSASGAPFDRQQMERTLAGLKSRVFLMNNVNEDRPVLFTTRWAMSYLRGPLTRNQIKILMDERRGHLAGAAPATTAATVSRPTSGTPGQPFPTPATGVGGRVGITMPASPAAAMDVLSRPVVPDEISQVWLPAAAPPPGTRLLYRPAVLGTADLHFVNSRASVDLWKQVSYLANLDGPTGRTLWADAVRNQKEPAVDTQPLAGASFSEPPAAAVKTASYKTWEQALKAHVYKEDAMELWTCKKHKLFSEPGESKADFCVRLREAEREQRDMEVEKLRGQYAPKLARMQERIRVAEERVDRERSQYQQQKTQTAISVGATVLGALFGRKLGSIGNIGRATTSVRGVGRAARERSDVARAQDNIRDLEQKLADLEKEFQDATEDLQDLTIEVELEPLGVPPRKGDIRVTRLALAWVPYLVGADGVATPAIC